LLKNKVMSNKLIISLRCPVCWTEAFLLSATYEEGFFLKFLTLSVSGVYYIDNRRMKKMF